jgi:hypothetical protein
MNFIVGTSYEKVISEDLGFVFLFGLTFQIVDESPPAFAYFCKHFSKK